MKKTDALFKRFYNWCQWNLNPQAVSTLNRIKEHFSLSEDECKMLEDCIRNKLLKEYIARDGDDLYIAVRIRDCMTLVRKRRKNLK